MRTLKFTLITFLLTFLTIKGFATSWITAYPYTQQIDGQSIVVEAYPYAPYSGSPMDGVTKVYSNGKLLYTIDKYYRENIFTSDNGQYLVIVNPLYRLNYIHFEIGQKNFNQTAIEVYKNGQPFKTFALKDVIDTTKYTGKEWVYSFDFEAFEKATWSCKYWRRNLTRNEKKECLNGNDTNFYCEEWINSCKSIREKFIYDNSIYVQNNSLFILTNQDMVVKLDFAQMTIQSFPFDQIIPNKQTFNPPKLNRKYKEIKLPDKFVQPDMKDGRSFEKAIAELFNLIVSDHKDAVFCIYIGHLVLNKEGKCVDFYGKVYDKRISKYSSEESINHDMTEMLNKWINEQTFDTKFIPKGFDKYSFLCIVDLKDG